MTFDNRLSKLEREKDKKKTRASFLCLRNYLEGDGKKPTFEEIQSRPYLRIQARLFGLPDNRKEWDAFRKVARP